MPVLCFESEPSQHAKDEGDSGFIKHPELVIVQGLSEGQLVAGDVASPLDTEQSLTGQQDATTPPADQSASVAAAVAAAIQHASVVAGPTSPGALLPKKCHSCQNCNLQQNEQLSRTKCLWLGCWGEDLEICSCGFFGATALTSAVAKHNFCSTSMQVLPHKRTSVGTKAFRA